MPLDMQYYVFDGTRSYGPVSLVELQRWQLDGRILSSMQITDELGEIYPASALLFFPPADSLAQSGESQMKFSEAGEAEFRWSIALSIAGFFFCFPLIGPILGLVQGYSARQKGFDHANVAVILGWSSLAFDCLVLMIGHGTRG